MKTHFQSILEFAESFEVKSYNGNLENIFETDNELMIFRTSLITEEVEELCEAIKNKDIIETIDALIDILYVGYGAYAALNIDADVELNTKVANELCERIYNEYKDDTYNIFSDMTIVKFQQKALVISKNELQDTVIEKNINKFLEALKELMANTYRALMTFRINTNKAFQIVHDSNMSKLCVSEAESIETVASYKSDKRYDSPAYRESKAKGKWIVYNKSTSKILKSINYTPANFSELL